jgi:uncharacterized membrane protein
MEKNSASTATGSYFDQEIPPGWSYNPASWGQRLPIVGLAIIGLAMATYLSLFQLKVIPTVWEPFFGNGSRKVLTSGVSQILPIPDGVLGALGYLVDALAGVIGGPRRWRTMPWIVVAFGLLVGPLGAISILLVVLQPVMYDAWCTLCLGTAAISILMIGPAMDEMLASLQYLRRVKDAKLSLWKAFWGYKEAQYKVM